MTAASGIPWSKFQLGKRSIEVLAARGNSARLLFFFRSLKLVGKGRDNEYGTSTENDHGIRNRVESIILDFETNVLISDLMLVFPKNNQRNLRKLGIINHVIWNKG